MNDLAVVTRAYDAEAPYIFSFLQHYRNIGVREFHIVIPKTNQSQQLKSKLSGFQDVYIHDDYDEETFHNMEMLRSVALPYVTTSHILNVDVDEYLYIDDVSPLLAFNYIKLNWIIAPYLDIHSDTCFGFIDRQCKYIVRTDYCISIEDHYAVTEPKQPDLVSDYHIIHYVYRSFNDIFLKCAISEYSCYQRTDKSRFHAFSEDIMQLPLKFKMAAIYRRLVTSSQAIKVPNYCHPDRQLEQRLVETSDVYPFYSDIYQAYCSYSSRINLEAFLKEIKKSKEYHQYQRIPHFLLSQFADATLLPMIDSRLFLPSHKTKLVNRFKHVLGLS